MFVGVSRRLFAYLTTDNYCSFPLVSSFFPCSFYLHLHVHVHILYPPPPLHCFLPSHSSSGTLFSLTCRIQFGTTCRCTVGSIKYRMKALARVVGGQSTLMPNPVEQVGETGHSLSITATHPHQKRRGRKKRGKLNE